MSGGRFTLGVGSGERLNEHVLAQFACGPDPARFVEVAQQYVDAGFDRLVTQNAGPDPDGFMDFYQCELDGRLRGLTPGSR
ncbi:alkanesulfonate monooxygenase SsuD/methylene tetrahydromethanopterin reductase-like flavin-dependent oxidoreductase (luciferase family) [Streptosporangium album]|uniref:Alkanesulfonate monooxygenase SsuD/methylene tetrahydromethanopterin reductase-like flavin-dependent oxidoreductase (Luciferase family) n=1 Tax=Streptosporangium album TaxID=47479 RepID=A0A7W7S4R9_9ACTN|nr:alkanesulfonate monooxygenase SsuD/methylene tetrahydromethanopterin reductase-like flavin-dependent oxidoreductase (luciferase family) [Streptosporangium album]